jgi:hypothetical protein
VPIRKGRVGGSGYGGLLAGALPSSSFVPLPPFTHAFPHHPLQVVAAVQENAQRDIEAAYAEVITPEMVLTAEKLIGRYEPKWPDLRKVRNLGGGVLEMASGSRTEECREGRRDGVSNLGSAPPSPPVPQIGIRLALVAILLVSIAVSIIVTYLVTKEYA